MSLEYKQTTRHLAQQDFERTEKTAEEVNQKIKEQELARINYGTVSTIITFL